MQIKRAKEEIERLNVESDLYEIYIHRDSREIDLHGKDPVRAQKAVVNKINFCHGIFEHSHIFLPP
jgi:hypothetical protein